MEKLSRLNFARETKNDENKSSIFISPDFKLAENKNKKKYFRKDNPDGSLAIAPIHCLAGTEEFNLESTHHHYTDIWSNVLFDDVTKAIHIGAPGGPLAQVTNDFLILWSHDGHKLLYQQCRTFECAANLLSGTPIYNNQGKLCTVVTYSLDNKYCISEFQNVRGKVTGTEYSIKPLDTTKCINYAHTSFNSKEELNNYLKNPENINTIVIRMGVKTTRIIKVKDGVEDMVIYFDQETVKKTD